MTTIYFIRHAQSDYTIHDVHRPLTDKGMRDRVLVTDFLQDKPIAAVLSSPYKRAVDTVAHFAAHYGLPIETIEDFRERSVGGVWTEDFDTFAERQWVDFTYKLPDGESLAEVQQRNIAALDAVLARYHGQTIAIGTHGTALSTIINHYDPTYGYADFMAMVAKLPWIVRMDFNDDGCIGMEKVDVFNPNTIPDYEKCITRIYEAGTLKAYRFVVIFARYQNQWLYCRAKSRDTYETAGGHVEPGETPLDAAKRELYEETGAVGFDIHPVFDYTVHVQTGYSNGQVFLAHIDELGTIPDYEMAEVAFYDTIPPAMRFPKILPVLYARVKALL